MNDRVADNAVTASSSIRIAVIDDHPIFRGGVVRMLKGVDGVEVVGEGASMADALKIAQELAPDVMLLNLRQRGGAEAAARIADVCPNVRTVILTASENEQNVTMGLQVSARSYVMTGSSEHEMIETVRATNRDDSYTMPKLVPRLLIKNGERINTVAGDNLYNLSPESNREQ